MSARPGSGGLAGLLGFFVDNKLVVVILTGLLLVGGLVVSPWAIDLSPLGVPELPRDPVPVDAIPDIGENQQIVFTRWPGRSPRDVEDQISYPLTSALLGLPGVKTVRASSMLGFSSIYVIFEDDVEFYWSRARVLEKLASLPADTLPPEVSPTLGPDATALGQVFWYTLEGRDRESGELVGGWDLHELRSVQDWTVRSALQSVPGVSEVASIGGYVQQYQVEVDPEALVAAGVTLGQVATAVAGSNLDVGARTLEINNVEYLVRGVGFLEGLEDLEQVVVTARAGTPIRVADVARVQLGPAARRGALDDAGAEVVGGVVVARFGANPMEVIEGVHAKIEEIAPGLPRRELADGREAQVVIAPFYDRSTLINETLGTLGTALSQQILITIIVVLVLLRRLRSAALISLILPLAVLGTFLLMRWIGIDANIMALGGIAIAIGTMVDMGIVLVENIEQHLAALPEGAGSEERASAVKSASAEVAGAVVTSVATTVVSFLPVFALNGSEARLFTPLAWTKTFALFTSLGLALLILPAAAHVALRRRASPAAPSGRQAEWLRIFRPLGLGVVLLLVTVLLTRGWMPLGIDRGLALNSLFVVFALGGLLGVFALFQRAYGDLLRWCLSHKLWFSAFPLGLLAFGLTAWLGFSSMWGWLPRAVRSSRPAVAIAHALPGFGREYMPPFDEGSFLYMPTTMPHASIGQALDQLRQMDASIAQVPEVARVVGKLGRVDSALDPAPISMFETMIELVPEYRLEDGRRVRQWRDAIRSEDDIWEEIVAAASLPGLTLAPKLQPISTRIVMLQSGMRAPMGIKLRGPDLATIERFGLALEEELRQVPQLRAETVFADRVVGKPYLEIEIDRSAISRYGLTIGAVQQVIQIALGGRVVTRTVEGRERYPVQVRYAREERDSPEQIARILVDTPGGPRVPLGELAAIRYARGPQAIRSEDTFLTAYVLFDRQPDVAEVEAVEAAQAWLAARIADGALQVPAGVSFDFAGSYQNQLRSEERLRLLVPLSLALIFLILYLQFRRGSSALLIFSGVAVAASGGFALVWLYGQPWFLDLTLLGVDLRDLFQVGTVNLSVAVWIGFIALVGIATDDGVVMASYLKQRFAAQPPTTREEVRARTLEAGRRRIRPCLMTTATTVLALVPVLTSQGRGSDVMVAMALPVMGGMSVELITLFVVPVLWAWRAERGLRTAPRERI